MSYVVSNNHNDHCACCGTQFGRTKRPLFQNDVAFCDAWCRDTFIAATANVEARLRKFEGGSLG
jgi:hypothetical protein